MLAQKEPEIRTFRLTTKKKQSIRYFSEQKSESSSSGQSSFSSQYNLLTKKLKLNNKKLVNLNPMGSTGSSFYRQTSFRVRTESSHSKNMNERSDHHLMSMPFHIKHKSSQFLETDPKLFSTTVKKQSTLIKFRSNTNRIKRAFKVQKPSIYCQLFQQNMQKISKQKQQCKIQNKQRQQLQLNKENNKANSKLLQNCILLWNIRKQLSQKNNKIKPKEIIKAIKTYIMRKQQRDDGNNSMEKIFSKVQDQNDFKELLCCERIHVLGLVDLVRVEKIHQICIEVVKNIDNFIGFYKNILIKLYPATVMKKLFQSSFKDFEDFCKQTELQKIQLRNSLTSTLLYQCTKIHSIYRYSPQLLKKMKVILNNAKNCSINRSFYNLLTVYAVFLNEEETKQNSQNKYISKYLNSFMTCPSPFIVEPRSNKNYTLVLDLDQTLINAKFDEDTGTNYCIRYRPYCKQFVNNLSKMYQIIIFTSSISSYAQEAIGPFAGHVSHVLCRQHTIKIRGNTIKDLSRIGRSLQTTIIIDNMPQNFKLQTQNGIQIKSWYGQKKDSQLYEMEKILMKAVENNPKDIRESLKKILSQNHIFHQ